MSNRASSSNLLVSLTAFLVVMLLLLAAFGFGVGVPELLIWLGALVVGFALIVRRSRRGEE